jgi:site-specific recombinase XerD
VENDQDCGLKIGSVKTKLRVIYNFLRFLVDRDILPPEILQNKIQIKLPQLLPRAIPSEDIDALLAVIDKVRDRAMILLLLRTGLRIGELLNVKIVDIILPERKILIYLGAKNYQGRVAYYSEDAGTALQHWLDTRNKEKNFLFYSRSREQISYVAAWTVMRNILRKAGLSHKGYSLHSLRHTFATDMLNAGLRLEVLQQLLGHHSIEITRRYARMSDTTRETEYFKAITIIEQGAKHEPHRVNTQLQAVFEEKKLVKAHD